jgi:hypothetical protein
LVAAIALGGWAISSRNDAHEATAQTQELTQLLSSPDVKTASGSFATAGSGTVIVSASQGRALLVAGGLPALPSGKVYEAWTLTKAPVPAGTFTPSGSQTLVSLPSRAVTSSGVAITVEPDGGSPHPTTKPIFAVNLPKA